MTKPKPRRGAKPRAGTAATERLEIRLTRLERAAWELAAAQAGVSLSEWIRAACRVVPITGMCTTCTSGPCPLVEGRCATCRW